MSKFLNALANSKTLILAAVSAVVTVAVSLGFVSAGRGQIITAALGAILTAAITLIGLYEQWSSTTLAVQASYERVAIAEAQTKVEK